MFLGYSRNLGAPGPHKGSTWGVEEGSGVYWGTMAADIAGKTLALLQGACRHGLCRYLNYLRAWNSPDRQMMIDSKMIFF